MKAFSSNQHQSYKVISARQLGYEIAEHSFKYSRTENIAVKKQVANQIIMKT
jgi:hypothetical protein